MYIEEEQTTQWPKEKVQKEVRIPLRPGVIDITLCDQFVSGLLQVGGFLPIQLTAMI
jgi:hypothetical protein